MAAVELKIPRLGKGLQDVRIVSLLKQPGDFVAKDEVFYAIETDKATVDVEAAAEGVLIEWRAEEDDIVDIGEVIAVIDPDAKAGDVPAASAASAAATPAAPAAPIEQVVAAPVAPVPSVAPVTAPAQPEQPARFVPPRTRAYCREKGISPEVLATIPAAQGRLKPADIDRWLIAHEATAAAMTEAAPAPATPKPPPAPATPEPAAPKAAPAPATNADFRDEAMPRQQQILNHRFRRSRELVIPATLISMIETGHLGRAAKFLLEQEGVDTRERFVSEFQMFAFCVAQVIGASPAFRTTLADEKTYRRYDHLNLGIAVQRPNGDLAMAVVPKADTLSFGPFTEIMQRNIEAVQAGEDQADANTQFALTYMGDTGVIAGVPLLTAPASGILAYGSPYLREGQRLAQLSLTFDHQIVNGMEAAQFLQAVTQKVADLPVAQPAPSPAAPIKTAPVQAPAPVQTPVPTRPSAGISAGELRDQLIQKIAGLAKMPVAHIDPAESMGVLGVNSVHAVAVKAHLENLFNVTLPATLIWRHPTINSLVDLCVREYGVVPDAAPQPAAPAAQAADPELDALIQQAENLSPDELKSLLDAL